jgi:hypothetical protein
MTNEAAELLAVRLSAKYRAGIWLTRVGNGIGLPVAVLIMMGAVPGAVLPYLLVFMLATALPAVFLVTPFRKLFSGHGSLWGTDPEATRIFMRDLLCIRPRK